MILSQGILDELRHQAELQGKKNYRCIEVDWRTMIALCNEIESCRKHDEGSRFTLRDRVVFAGKEYDFGYYMPDKDGQCVLFEVGVSATEDSFSVLACNVRKAPL